MYNLILDSSTKVLYVAVTNDTEVLYEKYIEGKNDHAKNIVFTVDEALKKASIDSFKLDRVIVGYGPGSYTGVRMAVTVAKMMAVFAKVKLYTVSSLILMASGVKGVVKASIDARRGNAFTGVFDILNDKVLLEEGMYPYSKLDEFEGKKVTEDSYKVDPFYVIKKAQLVDEPHLLVPNYLRDTEAERNLKWLED